MTADVICSHAVTTTLHSNHLADLQGSGLSEETIRASGCYSATEAAVRELLGFGVGPGLVFPFPGAEIRPGVPFCQVKPDKSPEGMNGAKYLTPKHGGCRLYVPPIIPPERLKDPRIPLYVTEGAKKALRACQEGLLCVALAGVDAWRDKRSGESAPIPDLDRIPWKGRTVYVCYDSDLATKPAVRFAEYRLARELYQRGAIVKAIHLPAGPNGKKQGLDDFLVTHSVDSLCEIEPTLIEHPGKDPAILTTLPAAEPLAAFLAREIKSAPSLVGNGLIVGKGLHLLIGPTKKGKTILCSQLMLIMAGGLEYWLIPDLIVHGGHRILYLNLEMPEPVFEGRLQAQVRQAIDAGYNMKRAWPNFRHVTLRGNLRLDRKDGRATITRLIRETGAKLAVVDNLGAAMAVDSNSDERMAPIFLNLYEICESENVAILLVLHTPKELGDRDEVYWARGSSVQADRADTIITMKPYGNDEQAIQRRIGMTLRCGPEVDPIIVSRQRGSLLWTAGKQKDVRAIWMRTILQAERSLSWKDAFEAFQTAGHGGERTFRNTLKSMGAEIRVQKESFGGEAKLEWIARS